MKRTYLVLMVMFILSGLFAAEINYLTILQRTHLEDNSLSRRADFQIYHITSDIIVAGVSHLELLQKNAIPYQLIDDSAWSEKYYIISDQFGREMEEILTLGREIYRDKEMILIKTDAMSIEQITAIPYKITELYQIPLDFQFTKIHQSPVTAIPPIRTDVIDLVNEINPDSLGYFIQALENFQTRYAYADNRDQVANWIKNEFLRFGYTDVVIDSFFQYNIWHKNVVATLPGTINPEQIVIIGGHHDSIITTVNGDPMITAPGANDNASGTGGLLEIARVIRSVDFQPETSIKFITFAAEEVGLLGSHHYAEMALNNGLDIKLMINLDLIGYTEDSPDEWTFHIREYTGFENEAHFARQITQQYTTLNVITHEYNSPGDSYPFWLRGIPAVWYIENNFYPYIHTPEDLFFHINTDYAAEAVKAAAAVAVMINYLPPGMPDNFNVIDAGNGHELIIFWDPVDSSELDYYEYSIGLNSGDYYATVQTEETSHVISGLEEGVTYFIGLRSVATSGYTSSTCEKAGTPRTIPLPPQDFVDLPQSDSINLSWTHNLEADLAGYRLYRSEESGILGDPVHQDLLLDNYYTDNLVEPLIFYFYSLTAVDLFNNESDSTAQLRSRILSMDQGVLIVADTSDGNGSFQNPTLEDVTLFYNYILQDYSSSIFPLWTESSLALADLAPFSTIVWHKNNALVTPYDNDVINTIKQYSDAGGNILFSTYFPNILFGNNYMYPKYYNSGHFMFDYLKINLTDHDQSSRFKSALPLIDNYYPMIVDENKAPAGINYHIINVESIQANQVGDDIYYYHSDYPAGSPGASMNGMPVGVEYIGNDYKVITLSFPLYYMEAADARDFITYVMSEKFFEPMNIDDELTLPMTDKKFHLYANYPNPFNPETVIKYTVSSESQVNLSVYNLKGQRVKTLVNDKVLSGEHLTVWNGKDDSGREVASGIYFYQLITDFGQEVKKMILMK